MKTTNIETPKGKIVVGKDGAAQLVWNTNFVPKWSKRFSTAQKFVDSEVLRLSEPFTPLLTSMLIKSGILGTDIGSGTVKWIAPYARFQYYRGRRAGESKTGVLRGRFWFERMNAIHGRKIVKGAKSLVGKDASK